MLKITVVLEEGFDDETQTFVEIDSFELTLQHSLVSLSKWESKWKIPFLGDQEKTSEHMLDYIRCMSEDEIPIEVFENLSQENIREVSDYINDTYSATKISDHDSRKAINKEIVTAELIYYWMVAHTIPFECQHWHLNKLMTLIRVCNIKNQPEDKKSKRPRRDFLEQRKALNEKRKKELQTKG